MPVVRIGVVGFEFRPPSSRRVERVRFNKAPKRGFGFLPPGSISVGEVAIVLSDTIGVPTGRRGILGLCGWLTSLSSISCKGYENGKHTFTVLR
jgi:hypothetical protein